MAAFSCMSAIPSAALKSGESICKVDTVSGCGLSELRQAVCAVCSKRATRSQVSMANKHTTGPFAPLVVITRNIMGPKPFNQFRGKGIALHSQVITEFCKSIGADAKQRQGLIRLAKKNGEKLGFLA